MTTGLLIALLVAACAGPVTTSTNEQVSSQGIEGSPLFTTTIEGAVAIDVTVGENGPVLAWTSHDAVSVAELDVDTGQLMETREVSGGLAPVHHPIERPAVLAHPDGSIDVAFISPSGDGGTVYVSRDGSEPEPVSGPARPETNLVHASLDAEGATIMAWLEDSTLSVAHTGESGLVEVEDVDDLTCDCCNPVPVLSGEALVVAYRDYDDQSGVVVRNVVATRSLDGGVGFEAPVPIADEDWAIDGCPFSGPDVVVVDDVVVVAWMDARQSRYPDQDASSIWVDRSGDDGAGFGVDLEVASDAAHRWPTLAVDGSGVIHVFWETAGPEGGLSYAWSADGGASFSSPDLIVGRQINDGGAPSSPTAAYHAGIVVLTWADSGAGYVAAWLVGS